ncbi:unnamed protein product [Musa acuminata subsp. malaccensis]|uniref:(wild Malaysian banana) hypothetical protein n=1 Tax=Musa acuminata subsp. malaccensis TaxID=214687 RepID=A0A804KHK7_MUSAM|nr:PREDICTED: zinc finger protein ZAT3-like [Musa acuminata subsp. malaccensis]CAG1834634.1 unnamed protein product [Musa acuminata subsp. malaccensis]
MEGDRLTPAPGLLPLSKHRCKVCSRSFPSGRSLGGHMRSHVNVAAKSPSSDERRRENPRKTRKRSDSGGGGGEVQCKECGKEFLSWRALFGHMRCHSERPYEERGERDGSCSNAGHCNSLENQFDSEAAAATVSRKMLSKWIGLASVCSSSACQYEPEDEDGAISLVLLSKGVRHWSGGCSESPNKDSEVPESSDFVSDGSEKKGFELDDLRTEFKKVESDASDAGIVRDDMNPDSSKQDLSSAVTEPSMKPGFDASGVRLGKNSSSTLERSDGCSDKTTKKRSWFDCKPCNKVFRSYQALGGHRARHKRMKGCHGHRLHGVDNSMETDGSINGTATEETFGRHGSPKSTKGHRCPICSKFFSSGQALGGHKRSHLVANTACPVVIPRQPFKMSQLLDLNLPANGSDDYGGRESTSSTSYCFIH